MPPKKIVVKVSIHCQKCKQSVFKAVTNLTGIDQLSLDEEKSLLTIVGTVDPVDVVETIKKKTKKWAKLESVGPVEAEKPVEKKPEPTPTPPDVRRHCCSDCEFVGFAYGPLPVGGGGGGGGGDCKIL